MHRRVVPALLLSIATLWSHAQSPSTCTGLCLQQVTCPSGQTTSISGKIYAPNGTDPLPNVTVYIPNAPVDPFTAGVSCPVVGTPPSGSPLVGTVSDVDGSFTLTNVPVGANLPLVIVSGRWRRQLTVPGTTACADTSFDASMPKDHTEGDIPKIAIVTGAADSVECVLRKVGIKDSEFTDPSGAGHINFYSASVNPGARASTATPNETALDVSSSTLNAYDVLMLPCQGTNLNTRNSAQLAAFQNFVNSGGRVYASHYSYVWMYHNPPFDGVVNWSLGHYPPADNGTATVNQTFGGGQTLAQWLQLVGASTTLGQMNISTLRFDFTTVNPPTKTWLTLNNTALSNPVMQFTFDTPISSSNQCGRVLFDEYHVENPTIPNQNVIFPNECPNTPMTPQEKLLEYSLFSLTSDGGSPTLDPSSYDFGDEPVGFTSATKYFTWTNNSSFNSTVTSATVTGDFAANPINCTNVASGASCQIAVTFTPTVLGAATGTLSVKSSGKALSATLTGTGVPGLTSAPTSLTFGSLDVGASATQAITITNLASGAIPTPAFAVTGDFAATSNCGTSIPGGASCLVTITFRPTGTGSRTGTWASASTAPVYSGLTAALSGTGVDFTLSLAPASGSTIAGIDSSTVATVTPMGGFANPVTLSCTDSVTGSTCSSSKATFIPTAATTAQLTIKTTSHYQVIGYGGFGGGRYLWLVGFGSGLLLLVCRRRAGQVVRVSLMLVVLATLSLGAAGCSGKAPAANATYTAPGDYSYTVTVTDGFLTHTATYSLHVSAK
ncbi:choice-of-anchor D domain-containing protein [Terriglobus albidus]|uniref:choice-of-anchor D domain-containing protein n=1 Tax=Terriglobus albidus TaxID=1592106 RepID=UPI0021DFC7EC|nr:choice-of-anchor D domain-containing protein [Terriglobus albidus]